jgi:tetratricopeptide (TPR) repeat protein/predicted Ser/Thr protein kinase
VQAALCDEPSAPETKPPERIGSFAIVSEIARGGMGVVYLAEQDRPRRQVALKVLRSSVTSAETLRRFEMEAEILARLRHPGIATVYEAGVTALSSATAGDRVPYIAMEYVQGERLDHYAESHRLSVAQKLELLARVADAVHHAHVKGLIHRDLKPGNILVESGGEPKVVDFGIARIADRERGATQLTSAGQILGTVPYMSPEQLIGDPSAIDSRSDVYALGVVAFELLTGELPHAVKRSSIAEAARAIRDDPPRNPRRLEPRLGGDVETILLKTLEKEPGRRYSSAAELAADIRRFLHREPIQARPQSPWYQMRRFAQRNRGLVAALAGLALALLAAAAASSVQAVRAMRAEERAQQQLEEARRQADKFVAVNRFLEDMLAAASPEENPGGGDVTIREILGRGAVELDRGSLATQPGIELGVRTTIGNTYRALGEYDEARAQLERAVELGRTLYPDGHEDLAYALNKLARAVQEVGERDAAEALYRDCLEMWRRLSGPRSEGVGTALNNLALLLSEQGRYEGVLAMHEEALAIRRGLFGSVDEQIASSLNNIAVTYYSMGNLEKAEAMFRESLEMDRGLRGDLHPNVASTMSNLAMVINGLGRPDEAEPLYRRALELQREIYGAVHPKLAVVLQNLASLLVGQGKLDEAEPLFLEAIAVEREARGHQHPGVALLLDGFASLFEARGDFDRAESLHHEALEIRRQALGDDNVYTLGSRFNLARIAKDRGQLDRAARAFSALADDARSVMPADSRHLFSILAEYGLCLFELDRHEEAARVLKEAHIVGSASVRESNPRLREVVEALAMLDGDGVADRRS